MRNFLAKAAAIMMMATMLFVIVHGIYLSRGGQFYPMHVDDDTAGYLLYLGGLLSFFAVFKIAWTWSLHYRTWAGPLTHPSEVTNHRLRTRGPYRNVRHPFYAGLILAVSGLEMSFVSNAALVIIPFFVLVVTEVAKGEERHLAAKYGDAYHQWKERTYRFFRYIY